MAIEIKVLHAGDEAVLGHVATDVFDHPLDAKATREFLADRRHHLVVALDEDRVIGFASAVHYVHPDKPHPELWINEIGVTSTHRGRGVGKALLEALFEVGRDHRCMEAWVLTDADNGPALSLYAAAGGRRAVKDTIMFEFSLEAAATPHQA